MKKFYSLVLLGFSFLLMSCNGVGSKDTVVARIGNENLYEEDLDFLTIQNKAGSPVGKNMAATEKLLYSLAKLSKSTNESASYDSAWKAYEPVVRNHILAVTYTRFHLMQRLGYTDEELKKYFEEHRSEFDSSAFYFQIREEVAGRYYVSKNQDSLKKFMELHLSEKDVPANVEVLFFAGDSAAVSGVEQKFIAGVSEDSLSTAHRATIVQGKERGMFADSSVIRALFFDDSLVVGAVRNFHLQKDSSQTFLVMKVLNKTPAVKAREEDYRDEYGNALVMLRKESIVMSVREMLANMGSVVIEKLVPANPQQFYEDNRDRFMTVPGYEVYHIAMKDSSVLAKTIVNVKDLESFKAVAATISEKEETSENLGYIGHVKKGFALPYGVGMMPVLWPELEGKGEGYISSTIRSLSDSLYHVFYVSKVIPSEVKSFDRVEKQLGAIYADNVEVLDPATVLISKDGKPLYTKADLLKIFDAEPSMSYNRETHHHTVGMLAQAYVLAENAKKEGVDQSWEFRAMMRDARMNFITARYDRNHKPTDSASQPVPEDLKKFEYFYNENKAYKGQTYDEALPQISRILESRVQAHEKEFADMKIWNSTNVVFYDRSKEGLAPVTTAEGFLSLGDSAAQRQEFDEAIYAYQKVIDLFASRDTLFRVSVYNLAQTYSDAQKYEEAAGCFSVFLKVWPEAPEAEKAMFSLGFVLNENLNRNDQALEVLEDFQKRFPKSELKESVDWLVENIKSDGKLAEDLMKKIEATE